jgi:membrane associated rhomboid family serine protease
MARRYSPFMESETSTFGTLGRRLVAWIILIAVALIALKILIGIISGLVMTVVWVAALAALAFAVLWAVKRL